MSAVGVLDVRNREEFRSWLEAHGADAEECWVRVRRGRPVDPDQFYYLDAVEEALCFGWIDSVQKAVDGETLQRFTPRRRGSPWSELNKERVRRMERLGRMTDAGRAVLPDMGPRSFRMDPGVASELKRARVWSKFRTFPSLYRRIRVYNIVIYRQRDPEQYRQALNRLIEETRRGHMFGQWNDYGRLLEDGMPPGAESEEGETGREEHGAEHGRYSDLGG